MNTYKKNKIFLVSFVAALAGLLFGFDTGIISGALLFIKGSFPVSISMKEMIVGSVLAGAILGSLSSGVLTDRYGRRGIMLVIAVLFIIGTAIAALAASINMILFGRIFIGLAIGIGSYTAPLYIAEAAPTERRGGLVTLNQLMITIGIFMSYCVNYIFANTNGSWRWMFAIGVIPALLLGLGMLLLPESPRWLVKQKQIERARETLQYLRGSKNVEHEIIDIQNSLQIKSAGFKQVFAKWLRPVLLVGLFLGFLQQAVGINTIIYYAPTIFYMAGFKTASTSILATVGVGLLNVLATVFAVKYLDKIGRRPLLLAGLIGMGGSLLFLSYAFHTHVHAESLRWLTIGSAFIYIISFAFSLGALLWVIVAEIFPLEFRGMAMSFVVATSWFWNLAVSSTFLSLLNRLGASDTFMIYASVCILGFIASYLWVPETKGVTLEQIENNIRNGYSVRDIGIPRKPRIETESANV
jgi:sugar porter (SP) family MFS transporter